MYLYSAPISSGSDVAFAVPCREKNTFRAQDCHRDLLFSSGVSFLAFTEKKLKLTKSYQCLLLYIMCNTQKSFLHSTDTFSSKIQGSNIRIYSGIKH